jgi:hypothetical protein
MNLLRVAERPVSHWIRDTEGHDGSIASTKDLLHTGEKEVFTAICRQQAVVRMQRQRAAWERGVSESSFPTMPARSIEARSDRIVPRRILDNSSLTRKAIDWQSSRPRRTYWLHPLSTRLHAV